MNVLVTRPDLAGQQLVEMLTQQGIFAIHQPLFRIESGRELPMLPHLLANLKAGDYLFAVSKNAVDFAHQTLQETGFSWRSDLVYFAVGQGTANHFSSKIEQSVRYPIQSENSEGVLDLPEMQDLTDKQIVILRAETGRELFAEQCVERGATIQKVECYQRIKLDDNLPEKISVAKRVGIDSIIVTSGEILSSLVEVTSEEDRLWLFDCSLIVNSQRIALQAEKLGWLPSKILLSAKSDNANLLQTVLKYQQV